jgi:amino acid permease
MLEPYVQTVSSTVAVMIFALSGGAITNFFINNIIKNAVKEANIHVLGKIIIATFLYIGFCLFGSLILRDLLLGTGAINKENVDIVAIGGFVAVAVILEIKYQINTRNEPRRF